MANNKGMSLAGADGEGGWTHMAQTQDSNGMLSSPLVLATIVLPSYGQKKQQAQSKSTPLIHLSTFDSLRAAIDRTRRLTFALHAPSKVMSLVSMGSADRIALTGGAGDLDRFVTYHLYKRGLTGDFGEKYSDTGAEIQVDASILEDQRVKAAKTEANEKLQSVQERWQKVILKTLEDAFAKKSKSSVNFKDLADRAGPLIREAKEVHEELEKVLMEAVGRVGEGLPRYE